MNIGILGDGAMACLYGAFLSQKNNVVLIGRNKEKSEQLKKIGICVNEGGANGKETKFSPDAAIAGENLSIKFDILILFVKSYAVKSVLEANRDKIGPETYVMCLQNGAGHDSVISGFVQKEKIIVGTTQHGASSPEIGKINHTGRGATRFGWAFDCGQDSGFLEGLAENFVSCGFESEVCGNIKEVIWHKLFTNASASITTAILQVPMDFLAKDENAWKIVADLVAELVAVANADGCNFDLAKITAEVRGTCEKSVGGLTSIYSDIKFGRKTEVDAISGFALKKGMELGIPVPRTEMAVRIIHALEGK